MTLSPLIGVVDANVAIKVVLQEHLTQTAVDLFKQANADPSSRLICPDFLLLECGNILWKHVRKGAIKPHEAADKLLEIQALPLDSLRLEQLVEQALLWAIQLDISVYDAAYVAAAAQEGVPLITADDKLQRKLKGTACQVLSLADLAGP